MRPKIIAQAASGLLDLLALRVWIVVGRALTLAVIHDGYFQSGLEWAPEMARLIELRLSKGDDESTESKVRTKAQSDQSME
jgi:hypothetical protein